MRKGPIAERVRRRVAYADMGDDDMILASSHHASILSNTGSHAWRADAGHEIPPIEASLKKVYREVRREYEQFRETRGEPREPRVVDAIRAFKERPSLASLTAFATVVDELGALSW